MTPKEYLQQYRQAVMRAEAAMDHLEELQSMATRITPNYGVEGGGTHQTGDKLGAAVARIVDAESRVNDELEMLEATEREVIGTISKVQDSTLGTISKVQDSTLGTILYERYINGKTFERIAVSMNYSWRQTIRLHGSALNEVKSILVEEGKI